MTPATEHDWQPLRQAVRDALWTEQILLPRVAERALVDAVIGLLEAQHLTLTEGDIDATP